MKEEKVFQRGLHITSDFDTGNPDVAAFSNEDVNIVQPTVGRVMRRAFHLGKCYDYYLVTLKVGVKDVEGAKRCKLKACRAVLWWSDAERNPYLLANPARRGFVGRDLMLTFPFSILLSGREKRSKVFME